MNLLVLIQNKIRTALTGLVADVEPYAAMVKPTQDPKHGDYQANCAMALGKQLGKKPRDMAQEIVNRLEFGDQLEQPEIAGPGFINLRLKTAWLASQVQAIAKDERLGVAKVEPAKTFVIDYSSPNVAKPLHVGHLRSTIIGDALTRLLRFLGHTVITDNHLGDWGTQFGMLLFGYKKLLDKDAYKKDPLRELARLYVTVRNTDNTFKLLCTGFHKYRDNEAFHADPVTELARLYVNGLKRQKDKDAEDDDGGAPNPIAESYRNETAKLHAGEAENVALWKEFMPHCLAEIHKVYERLGTLPFDREHGESFYHPMLPELVEQLIQAKVAEIGEGGAVIIRLNKDKVSLIRKSDGAFTYTTTDLATIQYRMQTWKPDVILYVVDFRQAEHFANLFEAAKSWSATSAELRHISFGSVLGKDGKPLSTREGGGAELLDLLKKAVEIGLQEYELSYWKRKAEGHEVPELTEEVERDIAETVGIGAVKYADLCQNRVSDYKFDYKKMLATEGNTATYMQYAYARNRSILRKAEANEELLRSQPPALRLHSVHERALGLQLLKLEEVLQTAAADYEPHVITAYLWDLAKTYSGFFQNCPVIRAESDDLKQSRLLLCDLTARVLQRCLDLLGIRTVERM
jgi:arginyl-tRNA synthetase